VPEVHLQNILWRSNDFRLRKIDAATRKIKLFRGLAAPDAIATRISRR